MTVVTISGQFGAGAREVGQLLADRLQYDYVDQAVLVAAARALGVAVNRVAERDERADTLRERIAHFLERMLERSAVGGVADPFIGAPTLELMLSQSYQDVAGEEAEPRLDDRVYLATISRVISDLANRGRVVIIGRGSQMILRAHQDTVHLQVIAELSVRIARVQALEELSPADAEERIRSFDRARVRFHKKFWKVDVWDPRLYDAVLNTTSIDYDTAAEIGCLLVQRRAAGV